ncbi:hypothetical protein [Frateuria sp. STR12]|uniref:hypothetical protein n=1 Tax=Frateuria hangzhouensis TaxID=2995589 RepID=UPI002260D489|nr:hypothetical protein [Frateuria sp. STR12]MCX7514584.1 hypothetical protein [Frateuria sp. STR12]
MGLNRCLFGCLLALSSVGTASAMGASTQDPIPPHATIDSGSRDGGGDASSDGRDCTLPGPASDSSDAGIGSGGGDSMAHPRASHRSGLGWQSLLPGSIQ